MATFPASSRLITSLISCLLLIIACREEEAEPIPPVVSEPAPQPEQYGTPFDQVPAIGDVVMYEVNPRVFSPAQTLDAIIEQLDSIQVLGVNTIWLMPIYQTGEERSVGSPYAVQDYRSIHSDYGDLEDLRELVDAAHERGMAVILDWVANHTAWDHDWISNPAWYVQDGNGNIIHPPGTNWLDVAELDFNNQAMREEMIQAMEYWVLEANVDGYRCDFASGVPLDFWQAAIDRLRAIPDRDLILFAESDDKALLGAGFDLIFGWPFYGSLKQVLAYNQPAQTIYNTHLLEYASVREDQHILRWTSNHDEHAWEETPQAAFVNQRGAMAAFVLASHMGAVIMLYNGQEVMVPQQLPFFEGNSVAIDWSLNPAIKAEYKQILAFRQASEALHHGDIRSFSSPDVVVFRRAVGMEEVLVLVNVRNRPQDYVVPAELSSTNWVNAHDGSAVELSGTIALGPFEYFVLHN